MEQNAVSDSEKWLRDKIVYHIEHPTHKDDQRTVFGFEVTNVPFDIITKYVLSCNLKDDRHNRHVFLFFEGKRVTMSISYTAQVANVHEVVDYLFGSPIPNGYMEQYLELKERVIKHVRYQTMGLPCEKVIIDDVPKEIVTHLCNIITNRQIYNACILKDEENHQYLDITYHSAAKWPDEMLRCVRMDLFVEEKTEEFDQALADATKKFIELKARIIRDLKNQGSEVFINSNDT